MRKFLISTLIILLPNLIFAQKINLENLGFRHLITTYKGDTVDILLKSKKGDELQRKPIFLFCQGSLPQPLLKTEGNKSYSVFPFKTDSLEIDYHIVIISKPFIPIEVETKNLGENLVYEDQKTGRTPIAYSNRNVLDYYVDRNVQVINFLQKLSYINRTKLVVAGHSEGSTVAAKIAMKLKKVTHLIYASGNPFGRVMTILGGNRASETDTDSTRYGESFFQYWQQIVNDKENLDNSKGDTYKATYDFSIPPLQYLEKLKIPVLICYGTKDMGAPYNDFCRVDFIRKKKLNFTFKAYVGLDHNFFPLTANGQPDYDKFGWDKVANEWYKWIK